MHDSKGTIPSQYFLTPEDVARKLCVHTNTVRLWCEKGTIGTRVGGRWRILPHELRKVAAGWGNVDRSE